MGAAVRQSIHVRFTGAMPTNQQPVGEHKHEE